MTDPGWERYDPTPDEDLRAAGIPLPQDPDYLDRIHEGGPDLSAVIRDAIADLEQET